MNEIVFLSIFGLNLSHHERARKVGPDRVIEEKRGKTAREKKGEEREEYRGDRVRQEK